MGALSRVRSFVAKQLAPAASTVADNRGGWWPWIREPFAGAWQRNQEWTTDTVLAHHAVYACITLIANDIGKLRPKLVEYTEDRIWQETVIPRVAELLRRPNHFQNRIQFQEWWTTSKLTRGNTYALKQRNQRKEVERLYLLDPSRVEVLVAPEGQVFYQLQADNLAGLEEGVAVPASEIIHDRINCLFHPLVGVSPIFAAGTAANVGLKIEGNAASFFGAGSNPSGILVAPTNISPEDAEMLSDRWNSGFSGDKSGKVAVLGGGLSFEPLRMTAVDAQMIEHMKWSAETVASVFHVPAFKIGVGELPAAAQNANILNQVYYSDCLQSHIEQYEACMDDGLDLMKFGTLGIELDLDGLLRMDEAAQTTALTEGIKGGLYAPNEARKKRDLKPLEGGDTIYLQHQDYPMEKVFHRTDLDAAPGPPPAPPDDDGEASEDEARAFFAKRLETWRAAA